MYTTIIIYVHTHIHTYTYLVALGLAKKIHLAYPEWGGDFATVIVSVVIINQCAGPVMCKYVFKLVGEANANKEGM